MPATLPVAPLETNDAAADVQQIYKAIQSKMNMVPNIFKTMGHSSNALSGFLALSEAANKTSLSPQLKEKIALLVGQANGCQYCLSAHTLLSKLSGLNDQDIMEARKGATKVSKEQAILTFVKSVVEKHAHISENELANLKAAGVSDQEIVETILVIMVNMFTNYFNLIIGTKIDFPEAPALS